MLSGLIVGVFLGAAGLLLAEAADAEGIVGGGIWIYYKREKRLQ
jgi:hypothetical protein